MVSKQINEISESLDPFQAMALENEDFDIEQMKWVVLMVLFNQPGEEAAYAWMEDMVFKNAPANLH